MANTPAPGPAPSPGDQPGAPLLTPRAAVILLLALITGVAAGTLGYLSGHCVSAAALTGGAAAGAAVMFFNSIVGR